METPRRTGASVRRADDRSAKFSDHLLHYSGGCRVGDALLVDMLDIPNIAYRAQPATDPVKQFPCVRLRVGKKCDRVRAPIERQSRIRADFFGGESKCGISYQHDRCSF